jgi:anaerobic selenocysteine-containing dehydrogenase
VLELEKYYLRYKVEAFMICGANPIRSVGQRERFIEAFKRVSFVFASSLFFDEPTMIADVVELVWRER